VLITTAKLAIMFLYIHPGCNVIVLFVKYSYFAYRSSLGQGQVVPILARYHPWNVGLEIQKNLSHCEFNRLVGGAV
jgi:hypothetical protein